MNIIEYFSTILMYCNGYLIKNLIYHEIINFDTIVTLFHEIS